MCKYNAIKPSDWIRHINSSKHQRDGNKKTKKCDKCDTEFFSHWNLKHHILVTHATIEERKKEKYYCSDCDQVFFCSQYMKKHLNGKRHKNYVLAIKMENDLNEKIKTKN